MNDKIKEFAGKALDKAVSYTWTQLDYDQIQELLACHAELIVQECAIVANEHVEEIEGVNYGVGRILKNHFGVS